MAKLPKSLVAWPEPIRAPGHRGVGDPPVDEVEVSIIIPIFNEADNLKPLFASIHEALSEADVSYEVIAIDDGSTDESGRILDEWNQDNVHVIHLCRNSGQTASLMAGFDHARGSVIVPIDADLQNDPNDIPRLLAKLSEGYDVVSGWRTERKDAKIRRNLPSRLANRLISRVSGVHLHDYGCSLKAYRRGVLRGVHLYGEMHRFIPIYAFWNGARLAELPVAHHPRRHGASKYGLKRIPKVIMDLVVVVFLYRFGQRPMYIFGTVGLVSFFVGGLAGAGALYYKFSGEKTFIETPLPLLFVLGFITGAMCLLMGLLAELLVRTYFESQNKTTYMIDQRRFVRSSSLPAEKAHPRAL